MVGLNGKVSNGAGNPAHKAGFDVEPMRPCITRQMTPEERKFYGVKETKKGETKKMGQKRGPRIDIGKLEQMARLIEKLQYEKRRADDGKEDLPGLSQR